VVLGADVVVPHVQGGCWVLAGRAREGSPLRGKGVGGHQGVCTAGVPGVAVGWALTGVLC
jgi:hypothetical protein